MSTPDRFEEGLLFFNQGDYFAAHEAWEDVWRAAPGTEKKFYQGLIQAAVGLYHLHRGNRSGADSQLAKAIRNLRSHGSPGRGGGADRLRADRLRIDVQRLIVELTEVLDRGQPVSLRIVRLQ